MMDVQCINRYKNVRKKKKEEKRKRKKCVERRPKRYTCSLLVRAYSFKSKVQKCRTYRTVSSGLHFHITSRTIFVLVHTNSVVFQCRCCVFYCYFNRFSNFGAIIKTELERSRTSNSNLCGSSHFV